LVKQVLKTAKGAGCNTDLETVSSSYYPRAGREKRLILLLDLRHFEKVLCRGGTETSDKMVPLG